MTSLCTMLMTNLNISDSYLQFALILYTRVLFCDQFLKRKHISPEFWKVSSSLYWWIWIYEFANMALTRENLLRFHFTFDIHECTVLGNTVPGVCKCNAVIQSEFQYPKLDNDVIHQSYIDFHCLYRPETSFMNSLGSKYYVLLHIHDNR